MSEEKTIQQKKDAAKAAAQAEVIENHDLVIPIDGGGYICTDGEAHLYGSEVTVYDEHGDEKGYWTREEWIADAEGVMGAMLACAAKTSSKAKLRYD